MNNFELISFPSSLELATSAAGAWLNVISSNPRDSLHTVALSGGRIAGTFFSAVVEQAHAQKISFANVHFFWADERCVPPNDAESNFRVAKQLLLDPLKVANDHTHRIRGEESQEFACAEAEAEICRIASLNADTLPVLDLIILGLGEDGHVASLFPGQTESFAAGQTAFRAINHSPKPPPQRITLSYAAITAAKDVWVLASGAGKAEALRDSLASTGQTPLAQVISSRPHTRIFSDIKL